MVRMMIATLALWGAASLQAAEKPNVLFIISDDLNTSLSGFGHEQCETPNLDRLAARGMKFQNMHCQYPVCGASRASMMSGLYPYTSGTLGNQGLKRDGATKIVSLPELFRGHGYYAARVSKIYHMNIPMDIIAGETVFDDADSWDEAINVQHAEDKAPGVLTNWSPGENGSQAFRGIVGTEGDADYADGKAADRAIEMLETLKDRPFFLAVGFVRPHVPLVAPAKYFELYDRDAMVPPSVPENDLDDVPQIIRPYKEKLGTYGVNTLELHQGLLQAYYASVSYMDAQVGRVLAALDEKGLADNTIVVFTSDHGYLLGHHHKFQKQHLFEESTRVPFIFSVPWQQDQHGQETTKITELIDMYPTVAELASLPVADSVQGTSMTSLLADPASEQWGKQEAFSVSRSGGESIRTNDWRFTQWGWGDSGFELYDLKQDPGEFNNLASDPKFADVVEAMRTRLNAKRDAAGFRAEVHKKVKRKKKR